MDAGVWSGIGRHHPAPPWLRVSGMGGGAERTLIPILGTPMSPEPGTHTLATPTCVGCLQAGLRGTAVPVPSESGGMLQCSITEDIEPSLGHGRDLLLLGCSQILQEASSVRQRQMLGRSKAGTGMTGTMGKSCHTTQPGPQHRNPLPGPHNIRNMEDSTSSKCCREAGDATTAWG